MAATTPISEFGNFDDIAIQNVCEEAILQPETRNFVVEFAERYARAAVDLSEERVKKLIELEQTSKDCTRWINIWAPHKAQSVVKALAAKYKFSPRLAGIMCSDPNTPKSVPQTSRNSGIHGRVHKTPVHLMRTAWPETDSLESNEKRISSSDDSTILDLSHWRVVHKVWHFCSMDWGANYLCIGYNTLSDTEDPKKDLPRATDTAAEIAVDDDNGSSRSDNKPSGSRTWTWLILCDDGTVVSIYENPFADRQQDFGPETRKRLEMIRRNLLNVFKQLSAANNDYRKNNPIYTLDIRPGLTSNQSRTINITDSPSLLFYYLFDDWYSSYALVSKAEHQYADQLEKVREHMFQKPRVDLIQLLHRYGRELSVLKRMYQSYALIIERILDRQKPVPMSTTNPVTPTSHHAKRFFKDTNNIAQLRDKSPLPKGETSSELSTFGVPLCAAATVRFERLRDRIIHYAISEIQECLDEKEDLVFLNFNMITLKESQAVERLTRITILLAKVTILFMPVSLMTAYFSTQLRNIDQYSIRTYWIAFGVIMTISLIFLTVFGVLSGTLEGKPIYRSLTQTVVDLGKGKWRERRGRSGRRK